MPFPFLKLPGALRNRVYELLLVTDKPIDKPIEKPMENSIDEPIDKPINMRWVGYQLPPPPHFVPLTQVCQQIRKEYSSLQTTPTEIRVKYRDFDYWLAMMKRRADPPAKKVSIKISTQEYIRMPSVEYHCVIAWLSHFIDRFPGRCVFEFVRDEVYVLGPVLTHSQWIANRFAAERVNYHFEGTPRYDS